MDNKNSNNENNWYLNEGNKILPINNNNVINDELLLDKLCIDINKICNVDNFLSGKTINNDKKIIETLKINLTNYNNLQNIKILFDFINNNLNFKNVISASITNILIDGKFTMDDMPYILNLFDWILVIFLDIYDIKNCHNIENTDIMKIIECIIIVWVLWFIDINPNILLKILNSITYLILKIVNPIIKSCNQCQKKYCNFLS